MKIWYIGMLVLNLNVAKHLSTWKTEAGVLWIWEQPGLPSWDSVSETLILKVLRGYYPVLFGCTTTIIQSLQMEEGSRRGEKCHIIKTCLPLVAFIKEEPQVKDGGGLYKVERAQQHSPISPGRPVSNLCLVAQQENTVFSEDCTWASRDAVATVAWSTKDHLGWTEV